MIKADLDKIQSPALRKQIDRMFEDLDGLQQRVDRIEKANKREPAQLPRNAHGATIH